MATKLSGDKNIKVHCSHSSIGTRTVAKRNERIEGARSGLFTYDFKVGLSAIASSHRICQAFGDSAVNERTARHWFQKFRSGDLSLCDKARTGRPQALDDEALHAAIEEDRSQTCGELARQFNTSSETVRLHLHRLVVHYELLPTGQTVNADQYLQHLERVQQALHKKEPALVNRTGVLLLHDNARPHVTWVARNTIQRLGWETLYHLPYSLDLAPSDYPLFRSLDNHLRGKSLTNEADVHQAVVITSRTNNRLCCFNTYAVADGSRNFEPWSSDEDDT
ncbi:histone-lysine N-methyltransferase SETMAR [Trichonephila clavipes]|nr:histone-lysine N-methyltransferase SETMAR [Trichonephila clavipes]